MVKLGDDVQVDHIVTLPELAARGGRVEVIANSTFVALSQDALDSFAALGLEGHGHFDSTCMWIDDTEYVVTPITVLDDRGCRS